MNKYYDDKIYFLCKDIYYNNVTLFFIDTNKIICVPINSNDEFNHCKKIIDDVYDNNDIFICGNCHIRYLKSKITNKL